MQRSINVVPIYSCVYSVRFTDSCLIVMNLVYVGEFSGLSIPLTGLIIHSFCCIANVCTVRHEQVHFCVCALCGSPQSMHSDGISLILLLFHEKLTLGLVSHVD